MSWSGLSVQAILIGVVLVVSVCALNVDVKESKVNEPAFFSSPQEAVEVISELMREERWPQLAAYYDLKDTGTGRQDLVTEEFFYTTERPEIAHPAGFWRYKQPFPPGFAYDSHSDNGNGTVTVTVAIEIDQGGGMVQRGTDSFVLRKHERGYQIIVEAQDEYRSNQSLPALEAPIADPQ